MNTLEAFMLGQASQGLEAKVFDWDKAATLIKENKPQRAEAGLAGDWEYTGGVIYENGYPVPGEDTYVYLASTWATPQLELDGCVQNCYKMASEVPDWNENTYWPVSALEILSAPSH